MKLLQSLATSFPSGKNMFDSKQPLSSSDFSQGRFAEVADFIRETWPYDNRPSEAESYEILAQSLGYSSFHEAKLSAKKTPSPDHEIFMDVARNFRRLGLAPNIEVDRSSLAPHEALAMLFGANPYESKFVESWPLKKLGRWNYALDPCIFDHDLLTSFEKDFEQAWSHPLKETDGFRTKRLNAHTATSLIAALHPDISQEELTSNTVGDLIDSETVEALFLDTMPVLFREIFCVSETTANAIVKGAKMSMSDVWALPQNETSFPNLYSHMREHLAKLLNRKAISFYLKERADGSYSNFELEPDLSNRSRSRDVVAGLFTFGIDRDELESEVFRTYTWTGQIRSQEGIILAHARGTYIAGPAKENISAFELISALDEMSDTDVQIIDVALDCLQQDILESSGEGVAKTDINVRLLFGHGNVVTVWEWERSEEAPSGLGAEIMMNCIDELKRKFKRNMYLAGLISPYQYLPDADFVQSLRDQRQVDITKIIKSVKVIAQHENVIGVFVKGYDHVDGDSKFFEYCGEYYGDRSRS